MTFFSAQNLMLKLTRMWQTAKNYYHFVRAFFAATYFDFPSKKLTVIGITGTDGKTTTVNMLHHILKTSGKKVSSISSIGAKIADKSYDTGFHITTPSPWQIQKYLKKAVEQKAQYFILEATSHGLDQNRLAFINFEVAAITNITHEHLDYHKNKKNYLESKAKIFRNVKYSILNKDDQSFNDLKHKVSGVIFTYGLKKQADFNLKKYPIKLKILEFFNLENALVSLACAINLGISKQQALKALSKFEGLPGRLEEIDLGQPFDVYIDFAHTPSGLENVLKALRTRRNGGKLIAVFGAAGERDKSKRLLLGKAGSKFADFSIITAEDPRGEDVSKICTQIARGFDSREKYFIIPDRRKAIQFAIDHASNNDIVGLFGKGHEKSMAYGKIEKPWDEFKVAKKAINQKRYSRIQK